MQVAVASMVGAKEEFAVVTFNTDGLLAGQGLKMLDMEEFTRDLNNQGKVLLRKDAHFGSSDQRALRCWEPSTSRRMTSRPWT